MSKLCESNASWRILVLLVGCLAVYLYLYTNAFDGMRTSGVFRVMEADLHAVWKDKAGSVSYYLKLLKQDPDSPQLEVDSLETRPTTAGHRTTGMVANATPYDLLFNVSTPVLTLFTSWNVDPDKYLVHNITIQNWLSLRPFVVPVIFTNDTEVGDECRRHGWDVFPVRVAAADGIPVLKYMYEDVMKTYNSTFYGYSNGDILFTNTLIDTLVSLINSNLDLEQPVMMIGQRTNVATLTEDEGSSWSKITAVAASRGGIFTGYAEDYFITSRSYPWKGIAEVVIGRRAYDNWLVYNGRKSKHYVIDATKTLLAVHQTTAAGNFEGHAHTNRDYNHNLLVKIYKRIKYGAGVVECVERYTKFDETHTIRVADRKVAKPCAV